MLRRLTNLILKITVKWIIVNKKFATYVIARL